MSTTMQSCDSIGRLAATYQHSVRQIRKALGELGIGPVIVLDGIEHYRLDDTQVEEMLAIVNRAT